jgi:hypothetical protein
MRPRHFDASVNKMCCKLLHGVFFAVDKECTFRAGLLLPSEQLRLVGMSGKTINGVDAGPNRNILAKNVYLLGAVDNTARESPTGCRRFKRSIRSISSRAARLSRSSL